MITFNAGAVIGGDYLDFNIFVNDTNLGPIDVKENDSDESLRNAISSVDGVSASLDQDMNLVISSESPFTIAGTSPWGDGGTAVPGLNPGLYE